jgi:hypothetical protein
MKLEAGSGFRLDKFSLKHTLSHLQAETAAGLDALSPAVLDRAFKGELR